MRPTRVADRTDGHPEGPDDPAEQAISTIRDSGMVVLMDDDRDAGGALVMAADAATPEAMAFMIRRTGGILCVSMDRERASRLGLDLMTASVESPPRIAFTVSVDYRRGLTTGISAIQRAATIRALANPEANANDFVRPGHVFPLIARSNGVLGRSGHAEVSFDLARLAGRAPVGVIADHVNEDGKVQRLSKLREFAEANKLSVLTAADLVEHRWRREALLTRVQESWVDTEVGSAWTLTFETILSPMRHAMLVYGNVQSGMPVFLHRERILSDVFEKRAQGRPATIIESLRHIAAVGCGVIVYVRDDPLSREAVAASRQEACASEQGRIGQGNEIAIAAQILRHVGATLVCMPAAPERQRARFASYGIEVIAGLPLADVPLGGDESGSMLEPWMPGPRHFLTQPLAEDRYALV
jgi:3,4-dihydroxy 2-butanone 4-phosphate synthase / GTP cyclohydrolase II